MAGTILRSAARVAACSLLLSGCIVYAPTQPAPAPSLPPAAAQEPTPAVPQAPSVADTIAACRAIQENANIPIACVVQYIEGNPVMYVAFENVDAFAALWEPMTAQVGIPFCAATNRVSREAYVSVIVGTALRIFACETSTWSDWMPLEDDSSESF